MALSTTERPLSKPREVIIKTLESMSASLDSEASEASVCVIMGWTATRTPGPEFGKKSSSISTTMMGGGA